MVGARADNPHANPVALIPAGESIDDVDAIPGVEVVNSTLSVDSPDLIILLVKKETIIGARGVLLNTAKEKSALNVMRGNATLCRSAGVSAINGSGDEARQRNDIP